MSKCCKKVQTFRNRMRRESLSDSYVAQQLGMRVSEINKELLELKREQLEIKAATKQLIKEIENGTK